MLSGRRIVLTGAAGGIGSAVARCAAAERARLGLHDLRESEVGALADELGSSVVPMSSDLAAPGAAQDLWDQAERELGSVDVLVNNAGVCRPLDLDAGLDQWVAGWQQTLQVNLVAAAVLCRAAVRANAASDGHGVIINVASVTAFRGATPSTWAYAASKGGLVALTRSIARYHGRSGTTAFLVAPGVVDTDMGEYMLSGSGREAVLAGTGLGEVTTANGPVAGPWYQRLAPGRA